MSMNARRLTPICLALCLATTAQLDAQIRTTRTISRAPSISGISPTTIEVEPGGSVRFAVTGANLAGATELKFFMGIRELFAGVLTGRILSTSSTGVSLVATASTRASPGASYQMKLVVGTSTLSIPADIEIKAIESTISSVSQQTMDVEPGSTATLTVDGSNLDYLTAAVVTRNGSPVSNLTAEFVSGGTASRREIRLSAPLGASGPANVPLQLQVSGSVVGTSTVPTQLFSAYVAMPDLQVAEAEQYEATPFDASARFRVQNTGRAPATFGTGTVYWRGTKPPSAFGDELNTISSSKTIDPGMSEWVYLNWTASPSPAEGEYDWSIELDPARAVAEANENNNTASVRVTVGTQLTQTNSDLTIVSVATDPPTPVSTEGYDIVVTVRNNGAESPTWDWYFSSDCTNGWDRSPMTRLAPGQSVEVRSGGVTTSALLPGTHTCEARLHAGNDPLPEPNNANDTYQFTVDVSGSRPPPADLRVREVRTDPDPARYNRPYEIRVIVENIGPGTFWQSDTIRLVSLDCDLRLEEAYTRFDVSPTETVTFVGQATPSLMIPAEEKRCRLRIETGATEADETNNESVISWMVIP